MRRDRVLAQVTSDEDRKWLEPKLHYYPTLAERLNEMIMTAPSAAKSIIADVSVFCALIKDTRNYYTHFNPKLLEKRKVAEGADLLKLSYEMRAVLEILLLNDLGISGTPLDRIARTVKSLSFHRG